MFILSAIPYFINHHPGLTILAATGIGWESVELYFQHRLLKLGHDSAGPSPGSSIDHFSEKTLVTLPADNDGTTVRLSRIGLDADDDESITIDCVHRETRLEFRQESQTQSLETWFLEFLTSYFLLIRASDLQD
jgi:hypothetical protein